MQANGDPLKLSTSSERQYRHLLFEELFCSSSLGDCQSEPTCTEDSSVINVRERSIVVSHQIVVGTESTWHLHTQILANARRLTFETALSTAFFRGASARSLKAVMSDVRTGT
jgi:hypothetical protein